jgi:hypothetical protein
VSKFDAHLNGLKALYYDAVQGGPGVAPVAEDFTPFKKIPRLNRDIVITEKIDGTNAQLFIEEWGVDAPGADERDGDALCKFVGGNTPAYRFMVGSRSRWVVPERDNAGFARWAFDNAEELIKLLGVGRHFGEWWGQKIQRTYGLTEKKFSLFNVTRWGARAKFEDPRCVSRTDVVEHKFHKGQKMCQCCEDQNALDAEVGGVQLRSVPLLYHGPWFHEGTWTPAATIEELRKRGSSAAPGYMDPEGIVVFHEASGELFKVTIKNDEKPKGQN